jgi:hypothetical protein
LILPHEAQSVTPMPLTDEQIRAAFAGVRCPACDRAKAALSAFCLTDTLALTPWVRNWLARGPEDPYFAANFRSALEHLRLNPFRKRVFGWPYTKPDDLYDAGYALAGHVRCSAPGCRAAIVWFWTPTRDRRVAVNYDCSLHRDTCRDPEYFTARAAPTSAPKRRARR